MDPTPGNATVLLEHGGITAVFALGLLWMLRIVGMRLIAAIDRLSARIDEHTAADARVEARLARMEGVMTGRESVTPIEGVPIVPDPPRAPLGQYHIKRAKSEPGGTR